MEVDDASGQIDLLEEQEGSNNPGSSARSPNGVFDWFANEFGRTNNSVWICPSAPIPPQNKRVVVGFDGTVLYERPGVHDGLDFWGTVNSA